MKQGGAAEQTAELAIDDLGLDLDRARHDRPAGPGRLLRMRPTLVAGLDERSRRIMDDAEAPRHAGHGCHGDLGHRRLAPASARISTPRCRRHARAKRCEGDVAATSRMKAMQRAGHRLRLQRRRRSRAERSTVGGVDLDVGTATVPDTAFTATQRISAEDLALPDLEPVTMSEVGTKLDLARAYMDMGDPEGARNILEEVLQEGSATQKQEAQRLIESLPG